MTLMVRADVASVSVPAASGGCGEAHIRPVTEGVAVHRNEDGSNAVWPLTCPLCESTDSPQGLRADIKRSGMKKIRTINSDAGMKAADRYLGLFGQNEDMVPETPDEEKARERREQETAKNQAQKSVRAEEKNADALAQIGQAISALAEQGSGNNVIVQALLKALAVKSDEPQASLEQSYDPDLIHVSHAGSYTCQDCGETFPRKSNKGYAPKRCPDCKAKAAA